VHGLRVTKTPTRNHKLVGDTDALFFATYRTVGHSCPTTCTLLNRGCYAQSGRVALQQRDRHSTTDGDTFLRELGRIPHGAYIRLHVAGDIMTDKGPDGSDTVDHAYLTAIIAGARRRPDLTIYGYTHAWRQLGTAPDTPDNLTLNASCDTPADVEQARALGWQTTTVVPADTPWRRNGDTVICPEQTAGIPCADCQLCMRDRPLTVAFRAHGAGRRKAEAALEEATP